MKNQLQIGLMLTHNFAYYRGVLSGIRKFAETRPEWLFRLFGLEHLKALRRLRPAAVIASVNSVSLAKSLSSWRRPIVNVSAVFPGLPFARVGVDNSEIGRLAAAHFLERGLRHFGFVGPAGFLFSTEREAAFRLALNAAGHALICYHGHKSRPSDPLGRCWDLDRGIHRWLRALPKPVGVFVPNDLWGVHVTEACRQIDLRVPEQVALLGVDNDGLFCELSRPPLSSIQVPAEQIGMEAALLLEAILKGHRKKVTTVLLPPVGVTSRRSSETLVTDDHEVVEAVRFIRENTHLPLRVPDVLKQVPVARRSLERRVRAVLGRGLGEEIRRGHMERAKRLLVETDLPIKLVAEQAGFSDFRHMAVTFRQELGLSPSAVRRQLRGPVGKVGG